MLAPAFRRGCHLNASRKLRICWSIVALLASGVSAETRIYGSGASNYVFRGVSWSDDQASASAGIDWQHPSGIYAGGNVTTVRQGAEIDSYAGYTRRYGLFALDLGASNYDYSDDTYIKGSFREVYLGGQVGPVGISIYRGRTPFDTPRYWYGEVNAGVPTGPVTLELHYGISNYGDGEHTSDQFVGVLGRWLGLDWRLRLTHREDGGDVKYVAGISKTWTVSR
jgi:uncharacterized protein (TIGR02001 family)